MRATANGATLIVTRAVRQIYRGYVLDGHRAYVLVRRGALTNIVRRSCTMQDPATRHEDAVRRRHCHQSLSRSPRPVRHFRPRAVGGYRREGDEEHATRLRQRWDQHVQWEAALPTGRLVAATTDQADTVAELCS